MGGALTMVWWRPHASQALWQTPVVAISYQNQHQEACIAKLAEEAPALEVPTAPCTADVYKIAQGRISFTGS